MHPGVFLSLRFRIRRALKRGDLRCKEACEMSTLNLGYHEDMVGTF